MRSLTKIMEKVEETSFRRLPLSGVIWRTGGKERNKHRKCVLQREEPAAPASNGRKTIDTAMTPSTNMCTHTKTCEDSGDLICIQCALVVDRLLYPPDQPLQHIQIERLKREAFFADVCDADMMNEGVALRAATEYDKLRLLEEKLLETDKLARKTTERKMLAYSVYSASLKTGAARDPDEIAHYTGVEKKDLCKLQNLFPISLRHQKAIPFLARYSYFLGLTYKQQREIESMYNRAEAVDGHNDRTVIASLILIYCERHGIKKDVAKRGQKKIVARDVASVCGVAPSSIGICARLLRQEFPENSDSTSS